MSRLVSALYKNRVDSQLNKFDNIFNSICKISWSQTNDGQFASEIPISVCCVELDYTLRLGPGANILWYGWPVYTKIFNRARNICFLLLRYLIKDQNGANFLILRMYCCFQDKPVHYMLWVVRVLVDSDLLGVLNQRGGHW